MKLLKRLYEIHSPSRNENRIRTFIKQYVSKNIPDAVIEQDAIGNLYITRGIVENYPCIVAHLDQVQKIHSRDFRAIETRDIIFGYSPSKRQWEGLGADDKNGIWIALQCLARYDVIKIAFFVGEEIGCVGSNAANMTFFENCRFVIQPDRRGYNDIITQISWEKICSEEFLHDVGPERFGYRPQAGMMTDVEALRGNGLSVSCINLSCGYYEPHTDNEFTVKEDLMNCLYFVRHIIETCTKVYAYESTEGYHGHSPYWDTDDYNGTEDMMFDIMMANPDYTPEDAWEVYCMNFPELTETEFLEMYEERMLAYGIEMPKVSASSERKGSDKSSVKKKSKRGKRKIGFFAKSEKRTCD